MDDATAIAFSASDRALKPYSPGNVKVNGQAWPDGATYAGNVTLTWAHRNKYAQELRDIVHQDAGSDPAGPEGTYTIEVLIGGVVKRTIAELETESYVYTVANRTTDDADLSKWTQFRISAIFGETASNPRTTDQFKMA